MVRIFLLGLVVLAFVGVGVAGASFDYYEGDPVTVGIFNNLTGADVDGLFLRFSGPLTPENAVGVEADMQLESDVDGQLRYSGFVRPQGMWEVDWLSNGPRLEYAAWLADGVVVEEIWVHSPTAVANVIVEGDTVSVSAAGSGDPDGFPLARYLWQWSDGTLTEGVSATRWLAPGHYAVTLTVWDVDGNTGTRQSALGIGLTYTLTVDVIGGGTVTAVPHRAEYAYGDVVTLTPTAAPGWSFAGFDTVSPVTITSDTTVVATFVQDEYKLTVHVVGNGSVTKDLDRTTYHYGDVVTLTPTAAAGWSFSGFDTASPVTITGDTTVVATFTQDKYTLTVDVVGSGSVTKDPDQLTYHYGDVVTLRPVPGDIMWWRFTEWGGALSGSAVPATLTITGDTLVGATFVETCLVSIVLVDYDSGLVGEYGTVELSGGLSGTVTSSLTWAPLDAGAIVTLYETPNPGYNFELWDIEPDAPRFGWNPITVDIRHSVVIYVVFRRAW